MNLLHSLLLLLPLLLFITTTSTATIPPGSSLYASNTSRTWSSSNNNFFLGFAQVGPTSYTVSISYAARVAIWTTDSVAVVDSGGVFQFLRDGNLRLVNGSGATVWTSNTAKLGVTSASLDDTGNLVLAANTFAVWSSFENPTDTLVPSQNLTVNQTLRSGVHSFRLLSNGNITLTWNDSVVYWNQGLSSLSALNVTSPTLRLQPNGILTLSDASLRSGGTTTMTWAVLADQCQVYGYCGNMGICSYNESSSSPICICPSLNFEAVDVNDRRKGCKRKVEVEDCAGNVTMLELKQTKFFTFQAQQIVSIGITACRVNCLSSTSCFASTSFSDTNVWCYMKNTPDFVSGYQGPVLLSTSYVKVCGTVQPNPSPLQQSGGDKTCWKLRVWVVGVVVVVTILVMAALVGLFWWFCCKTSPKFGGVWTQLADHGVDMEQAMRAVLASFWCIQEHPSQRPTMGKVVQMLEGIIEIAMPPAPKALTEGSSCGTSMSLSSKDGARSTYEASVPPPSSSSSFQTAGISPFISERIMEKQSSSLLGSLKNSKTRGKSTASPIHQ
ncbi:G-type lectin S-receptor-like serine/threonine-protein kinase [Populus alba x Populus x berolinensis]|uniref:non-specific serine/threonine protein kinase n=1 Tax=Populus alba x Populus x berolinensis TaxID=444605 RepID=A0AAD6LAL2_9ROSI|nr:G-type lectin S-receptor-like serine/threonine-protein kinase [Populus alba x Populus x berolinensis]